MLMIQGFDHGFNLNPLKTFKVRRSFFGVKRYPYNNADF